MGPNNTIPKNAPPQPVTSGCIFGYDNWLDSSFSSGVWHDDADTFVPHHYLNHQPLSSTCGYLASLLARNCPAVFLHKREALTTHK